MGLLDQFTQAVDARKRYYGNIVRGLLDNPQALMEQLRAQNAENVTERARTAQETQSVMPGIAEPAQRAAFDEAMNMGLLGITAYHGSPHKFDKFDMSKIGTGEGAQAYGHGLYFAESPEVAKNYAQQGGLDAAVKLRNGAVLTGKTLPDELLYASKYLDQGVKDAGQFKHNIGYYALKRAESAGESPEVIATIKKYGPDYAGSDYIPTSGNMYKVDIPDEAVAKMLDWDKPLSQQPEAVREGVHKAFKRIYGERADVNFDAAINMNGEQIIQTLSGRGPMSGDMARRTSEEFRRAGIPGIRYLDGGSRGKGGTSNFVLFDDQLPKIIGRE